MKKLLGFIILLITSCSSLMTIDELSDMLLGEKQDNQISEDSDEQNEDKVDIDDVLSKDSEYIIVMGDTQEYTRNEWSLYYYNVSLNWIATQSKYYAIQAMLQTGDITSDNTIQQWENYYGVTAKLPKEITVISCIGNHDYTWDSSQYIVDRDSTYYSKFTSLPNTTASICAAYERGRMENIVVELSINNQVFRVLTLEYGPRIPVMEWAKEQIYNDDHNYIILTHEHLTSKGERDAKYMAGNQFSDNPQSPETVWNDLMFPYSNVKCLLCGHNGFSKVLFSENKYGVQTPQILFNIQYLENGGNGYVEVWEFPKNSRDVYLFVYDTMNRKIVEERIKIFTY